MLTRGVGLRRARQRGLSLVELMVGVAIGLIIVAGAAVVTTTQLTDTNQLTKEMQVQQDLRAAADLVARTLRQAGSWPAAATSIWTPAMGAAATVPANPYSSISATASSVSFFGANSYVPAGINSIANSATGSVQIRLNATTGALQALVGTAWQDITDPYSLAIDTFSVTKTSPAIITLSCGAPCLPSGTACWPTFETNEYQIAITGHAQSDSTVIRTVVTNVRIRNDQIMNNNSGGPLCPT